MRGFCRLATLAAAFHAVGLVGVSSAQTVMVTNVPPGASVELGFNATAIASTTADAGGIATLDVNLSARGGKQQTDVVIFVDYCENLRRVLLVEPGQQPSPLQVGCTRRQLVGLYFMQQVTTFVVDANESTPNARLRQGPVPPMWLRPEEEQVETLRTWSALPTGLMPFGGAGLATFRDAVLVACGTGSGCSGSGTKFAFTAGATFWFTSFLGGEFSYLQPSDVKTEGAGTRYRFTSALDSRLITAVGKVGVPLGPVRLYGQGGATYHWATLTTAQTTDAYTITVGDVTTTIPGGTQTFELRTSGWGWVFGGGVEGWVKRSLAIYGEGGLATLKGNDRDGGEGRMDDRVIYFLAGLKYRIGG